MSDRKFRTSIFGERVERGAQIDETTMLHGSSASAYDQTKYVFDPNGLGVRFRNGPTHKKLYEIINEYVKRIYSEGPKKGDMITIPIAYDSQRQLGEHKWLIIICEYTGEYGWNVRLRNNEGEWKEAFNFQETNRPSGKGCLYNMFCARVWDGPLDNNDLSGGSSCGATRSRKKSIKINKTRKNKKGKSKRLKRSKRSKQLRKKSIKSRKRR